MLHPEYKGKPLAVCGDPDKRHGIVLAKNEMAKKFGVKTGDAVWEAKQKAPNILIVPPHFESYSKYSKQMFRLYNDFTDMVEPFGADECWLDCTGSTKLFGDGKTIADTIRARVKKDTGGMTCSVGVSFNKVFAKLGSDMKKPDGTTVISRENYKTVVWGLPVKDLLMVGRATNNVLKKLNICTIGDLAVASDSVLKAHLGINGLALKRHALGEDTEPVRHAVDVRQAKSFGHGMTTVKDIDTREKASDLIFYLSGLVAKRMRKHGCKGSGVAINLRGTDLKFITRQKNIGFETYSSDEIARAALSLFDENWNGDPLRTITVSVFKIVRSTAPEQIGMFDSANEKLERLDETLDKIESKYGNVLLRASSIGKDFIYDKTEAEDFLPFMR